MTPLTALALRLSAAGVSTQDLRPLLESAPAAAATLVAHAAGDGVIVVVVDQLEELFTLCASAEERERFATVLAHLAASADGTTRVICTVRDDFLMHVESLAPLRASLSAALFLIGNPSRDDLVRTIVEPARRIGYELSDPELAGEMVDVVADRPGALALLSFTASRLWELRDRRFHQLTRKAYEGMGGVAGALGQHAETTFLSLIADEQRVAREAFRHLVTADKTRAVLFQDELRQRLASPRSDAVIAKLVDARLLAVIEGETRSQIEIIHEALIGAWPRLQQWTREDTADSRSREQIRAAAKQWADRDRPRELLWRGDLLRELARWRTHVTLTDLEAEFADASRAEGARGTNIRRALVAFAIVVTAVFLVVLARANAHAQHAQAAAEALLRDSTFDQGRLRMLQGDKLGALPFLAQAYKMGETGAANRLMIEEAVRPTRARVGVLEGTDKLWQIAYSPDGTRLATASLDGPARIWDATSGAQLAVITLDGAAQAVAFSPDGRRLAIGGRDASVRIWDVAAGRQLAALPVAARVTQVTFSPDGSQLLAAGDNSVVVWTAAGVRQRELTGFEGGVGAAFAADGARLATWDDHGHVVVFDDHTLDELQRVTIDGSIVAGAIERAGQVVAVGTEAGALVLVRRDGAVETKAGAHQKAITSITFSPDGASLATASSDGTARLWEVGGTPRATLLGHSGGLWNVTFSPDGELLATSSSDRTTRLWTTATGTLRGELVGHTSSVVAIAFRPDGARMATASWDHRGLLWDVASAQQFRALPTATVDTISSAAKVKYAPIVTTARTFAMLARDGAVVVWSKEQVVCRISPTRPIKDFVWSGDGEHLAVLHQNGDQVVSVFDAHTCVRQRELDQGGEVYAIAFAPDGRLAVGGIETVALWEVGQGQRVATFTKYPGSVVSLDFTPDGRSIAVTFDEVMPSTVVIQDLSGAQARHVYQAGLPGISSVVVDDAHHQVIASTFDHKAWVWDDRTTQLVTKLEGTGPLFGGRLSADHQLFVAVGGVSPTVWTQEPRALQGELVGHSDRVVAGSFIDDRLFITAGLDGVARVWDMTRLRPLLLFGGVLAADVSFDRQEVVLSDRAGARAWSPRLPVPNFDEIDRITLPTLHAGPAGLLK
ncbi:MAG: WD40 repeat domain-containing protein, partial [Proteobacteria bacterium]|nr:WD40 repeat domain-containing protein [Pseudomonadota bacterium]